MEMSDIIIVTTINLLILHIFLTIFTDLQSRGQIRLAGGTYPWEGRIEFLNDPLTRDWGTVCAQDWDWNEGYVVCRELGYHNTTGTEHARYIAITKCVKVESLFSCNTYYSNESGEWCMCDSGKDVCRKTKQNH